MVPQSSASSILPARNLKPATCVSIMILLLSFVLCFLARLRLRPLVCGSTHGHSSHTVPTVPPQSSNVTIGGLRRSPGTQLPGGLVRRGEDTRRLDQTDRGFVAQPDP